MGKKNDKKSSLKDKYKGVGIKKMKSLREKENSEIGNSSNNFLEIKDGTNRYRVFPPHDQNAGSFDLLRQNVWLPVEKDDGKIGNRTFPHLRRHAGIKKDLSEAYLSVAKKVLADDEDFDDKINTLTDWKMGIKPSNSWVCYAKLVQDNATTGEISILEYSKSVRDGIDKVISSEEENEAIEVDPFSSPIDGLPLVIKYKPSAKSLAFI